MKQFLFFLLIGAAISFSACKGEQGDPGRDGAPGTNGQDGNANVKSVLIDVTSADWIVSAVDNLTFSTKPCAIITQAIADKGLVMVYARGNTGIFDVGQNWVTLPYTYAESNGPGTPGFTESWWFHYGPNSITFNIQDNDEYYLKPAITYKVVAISATGRLAPINFNNYAEVKDYFKLED
jgi:hypothetical protein